MESQLLDIFIKINQIVDEDDLEDCTLVGYTKLKPNRYLVHVKVEYFDVHICWFIVDLHDDSFTLVKKGEFEC